MRTRWAPTFAHWGEIITSHPVQSKADLPDAQAILLDTSPCQLVQIAGEELPRATGKPCPATATVLVSSRPTMR